MFFQLFLPTFAHLFHFFPYIFSSTSASCSGCSFSLFRLNIDGSTLIQVLTLISSGWLNLLFFFDFLSCCWYFEPKSKIFPSKSSPPVPGYFVSRMGQVHRNHRRKWFNFSWKVRTWGLFVHKYRVWDHKISKIFIYLEEMHSFDLIARIPRWKCFSFQGNLIFWSGLPCTHLIKVLRLCRGSITYYINRRWMIHNEKFNPNKINHPQ